MRVALLILFAWVLWEGSNQYHRWQDYHDATRTWQQIQRQLNNLTVPVPHGSGQTSIVPCGAAHVDPGWCRPDGTRVTPREACVELRHTTFSWCREDGTYLGKP